MQTGLRFREDVTKMDMDTKAIVERIQDISELSYNYYKPLVGSIIVEKASERKWNICWITCLMYAMMIEC